MSKVNYRICFAILFDGLKKRSMHFVFILVFLQRLIGSLWRISPCYCSDQRLERTCCKQQGDFLYFVTSVFNKKIK